MSKGRGTKSAFAILHGSRLSCGVLNWVHMKIYWLFTFKWRKRVFEAHPGVGLIQIVRANWFEHVGCLRICLRGTLCCGNSIISFHRKQPEVLVFFEQMEKAGAFPDSITFSVFTINLCPFESEEGMEFGAGSTASGVFLCSCCLPAHPSTHFHGLDSAFEVAVRLMVPGTDVLDFLVLLQLQPP
ncbi:hypothetical protein FEM48_Zijuj07G0035200 [Ziziphus jujuba var. spinosa]|uniref:Uncharacterized protein n=1 Tax=Ziziphus jujuba var. spinosa TaxID=714518 RepID=A0A978V275_ZIZJJ|nr:hypothetical protein FEM48_Zijuj07G0035200 [Ziziphus jujuba var. spinosa]